MMILRKRRIMLVQIAD